MVQEIFKTKAVFGRAFDIIYDINLEKFGGNPCLKKKPIAKLIQIKKAKTYATSGGLEIPKQNALLFGNTTQQGFFKDDLTTF